MSVCDVYRLQAFVDGQLGDSEARELSAHVATCAACACLLTELRWVAEPLRGASECCPEGLQQRLLAAVASVQPLPGLRCEEALEWVSRRLDGCLSQQEGQQLVAHLEGCCVCARAAAEMELTGAMLQSIAPEKAPLGLLQRIQAAAELAAKPARKPAAWRRWAPSFAAVAAAAALFVVLLTNSPQTPTVTPIVAQTPALERATSAPPAPAVRPSASRVVAVVSAPVVSVVPTKRSVLRVVVPSTPAAPRRASGASTAAVLEVPRMVAPPVPASPALTAIPEPRQPVAVAMMPTRSDQPETLREVRLMPTRRVETPVVPTGRVPEAPQPVRVAAVDSPKSTPTVETPSKPAEKRHRTWVSRPASDEREVYRSDDPDTRLADARDKLGRDVRRIVNDEVKGFVIH